MMIRKKTPLVLLLAILSVCLLFGCSDREQEVEYSGIDIYFVTGFDTVTVSPIHLDGVSEAFMPDDPFMAGYDFGGWYYDSACTLPFSASTDTLKENTTLYAKWTKKSAPDVNNSDKEDIVDDVGFHYTATDGGYAVRLYDGTETAVTVPSSYLGQPVVAVLSGAFSASDVTVITLHDGITTLEEQSLYAPSLVTINADVDNAFFDSECGILYNKERTVLVCKPVKNTQALLDTVEEIAPYALYKCACDIDSALLPGLKVLTPMSFAAFRGRLTVGEEVEEIQKQAFFTASCAITFVGGSKISSLTNGAFDGYIGDKLTVPGSVKEISYAAFNDCTAEIDLSQTGLTALGQQAFSGYSGEKLVLPYSISSLGSSCFYKCTATVAFAENSLLTTIGENSFNSFAGTVTFPATVNKVERNAFYNVAATAVLRFSAAKSQITFDSGAFNLCKTTAIEYK